MEGFWTVLLVAFVGVVLAPGKSNGQGPFDQLGQTCPGIETSMQKCVQDSGIKMDELMALQSDPAKLQDIKGKVETMCKNKKFTAVMDCYIDAMKDKCPAQVYSSLTNLVNFDGLKEMTKYMCDNLDDFMDERYKTCTTPSSGQQTCIQDRAEEIQAKIKDAPNSEKTLAAMCYGLDIAMSCMKPQLKTCPKGGEAVIKMMSFIKPKGCEDYTLAAGMMKPSILMVFVITAFSLFFGYAY